MKNYISLLLLTVGVASFAQVGVNTPNPQQKFHIDGRNTAASTNPLTGAPTAAQQTDDVVITNNGSIGTGLIAPATRLDINNGTTNGAIKIVDGTQGNGKILTSDANGVGQWNLPSTLKGVVTGTFAKNGAAGMVVTSDVNTYKYANVTITLTQGVWMVNTGLTLKSFMASNDGQWVHFRISSSKTNPYDITGWQNLGAAGNNTSYAGTVLGSAVYNGNTFQFYEGSSKNFVNGSNIIQVNNPQVTLYLWIESFQTRTVPAGTTDPNAGIVWQFDTSNSENYLYANPI